MSVLKCLTSFAIALSITTSLPATSPEPAQIRAAVKSSLPFIEDKGVWWIEKKDCVSCHRVTNMVWTLSAAKRHGFQVSEQLDEWIDWTIESSLSKNDEDKIAGQANKEGVAQLLIALGERADQDAHQQLSDLLLKDQQDNGSWKAGGQLPAQKRPKPETDQTSTMWLALAMQQSKPSPRQAPVLTKAETFIEQAPVGKSTEWFVLRLLLANQTNNNAQRDEMVKQLIQQQQADGGWGWMVDAESDALGTGMAVYALTQAKATEPLDAAGIQSSIENAQTFLIETQREDGSWPVKGTKEKRKDKVSETAVYWGTTWAALGLIHTLPEPAANEVSTKDAGGRAANRDEVSQQDDAADELAAPASDVTASY